MILRYLQEPKKICTPNYKETCKKVSKPITRTYREKVCQKCRQRKPKEVVIKVPKEECFYEHAIVGQLMEIDYQIIDGGSDGLFSVDFTKMFSFLLLHIKNILNSMINF